MPKFSNRASKSVLVHDVVFGEATVTLLTSDGSFTVPRNVLTERIGPEDFEYIIEYSILNNVLTGVTDPDGTILFRIDDNQATVAGRDPVFLSKVIKNGFEVPLEEVIEPMMAQISPALLERIKNLPEDYLKLYFAYEVKISYLASNPEKPYLFDPTPMEKMHAIALKTSNSSEYPPLFMKNA